MRPETLNEIVILLMEECQARDELILQHLKAMDCRINSISCLVECVATFTRMQECTEKPALLAKLSRLVAAVSRESKLIAAKNIARHESGHEQSQNLLALARRALLPPPPKTGNSETSAT